MIKCDFLKDGCWNFRSYFSSASCGLIKEVISTSAAVGLEIQDKIIQGLQMVKFNVKYAYHLLENEAESKMEWDWSCIWNIDVIPRVQFFVGFMVHEKLIINVSIVRMRLSNNGKEDMMHVLRDCRRAKGIWLSLGVLEKDANFFFQY